MWVLVQEIQYAIKTVTCINKMLLERKHFGDVCRQVRAPIVSPQCVPLGYSLFVSAGRGKRLATGGHHQTGGWTAQAQLTTLVFSRHN